jgi:hypothetical protein
MRVFVLTAEMTGPDPGDYDGTTSVHNTRAGALARFDQWLDGNQIDRGAVHYHDVEVGSLVVDGDETRRTFFGGDPDPDLIGGIEMHWGINEMEVHE